MQILAAVDLTARCDAVLQRGFALARELDCDVLVMQVVDPCHPPELRAQCGMLAHHALSLRVADMTSRTGVRGSVEVFAEGSHADARIPSLVAMAAAIVADVPDQPAATRTGLGEHTAGRLIKATSVPLLLVKDRDQEPYRRVVVGIDFSPFSRAAVDQTLRFMPAASLHLVHAYHVPTRGLYRRDAIAGEVESMEATEFEKFLSRTSGERRAANDAGPIPVADKILREGKPVEVLRAECRRLGAHLLVVGSHGRTGVSRLIWGSVAVDLLRDPPCDVLLVRSPR